MSVNLLQLLDSSFGLGGELLRQCHDSVTASDERFAMNDFPCFRLAMVFSNSDGISWKALPYGLPSSSNRSSILGL